MKKNIKDERTLIIEVILLLLVLLTLFLLMSYYQNNKEYIVSFETYTEEKIEDVRVKEGRSVSEPKEIKKEGYTFVGWYYNGGEYDFTKPVRNNVKLEAKWERNTE